MAYPDASVHKCRNILIYMQMIFLTDSLTASITSMSSDKLSEAPWGVLSPSSLSNCDIFQQSASYATDMQSSLAGKNLETEVQHE